MIRIYKSFHPSDFVHDWKKITDLIYIWHIYEQIYFFLSIMHKVCWMERFKSLLIFVAYSCELICPSLMLTHDWLDKGPTCFCHWMVYALWEWRSRLVMCFPVCLPANFWYDISDLTLCTSQHSIYLVSFITFILSLSPPSVFFRGWITGQAIGSIAFWHSWTDNWIWVI